MFSSTTVKQIMSQQPPVALSIDMPIVDAVDTLLEHHLTGAPVLDPSGQVVGYLSSHDVMVELWCQDYLPVEDQKVVDLMSKEVVTIDANEPLIDVAEFLSIDKETLYPSSQPSLSPKFNALAAEEHAKTHRLDRPYSLPVLEQGHLVGILTRFDVFKALRPIYGEKPRP